MTSAPQNVSGEGRIPRRALLYAALSIITIVWVLPTLGLLINSFRNPQDIRTSGWWTVLGGILDREAQGQARRSPAGRRQIGEGPRPVRRRRGVLGGRAG